MRGSGRTTDQLETLVETYGGGIFAVHSRAMYPYVRDLLLHMYPEAKVRMPHDSIEVKPGVTVQLCTQEGFQTERYRGLRTYIMWDHFCGP